jgi:hypothetical protein
MLYTVEIYIPSSTKYSKTLKGLTAAEASKKVANNIYISGEWANKSLASELENEITQSSEKSIMFWCDREHGAFGMVCVEQ